MACAESRWFVVPNHLTEQWGTEFLSLYPAANILVATQEDFSTENRKKFCARIATGDYDAVIIGHSQFEKIPLSAEYQEKALSVQLNDIEQGILQAGERSFSVKEMERTKKSLKRSWKSFVLRTERMTSLPLSSLALTGSLWTRRTIIKICSL